MLGNLQQATEESIKRHVSFLTIMAICKVRASYNVVFQAGRSVSVTDLEELIRVATEALQHVQNDQVLIDEMLEQAREVWRS